MNRARLYTLNQDGDEIKFEDFPYVEDAIRAAEAEAGEKSNEDEWGDTQIGYEWMTKAGRQHLDETGDYPERYWQIVGLTEDGQDDEVGAEHHRQ